MMTAPVQHLEMLSTLGHLSCMIGGNGQVSSVSAANGGIKVEVIVVKGAKQTHNGGGGSLLKPLPPLEVPIRKVLFTPFQLGHCP